MIILSEKDEVILKDYLHAYKQCFEAMNDLLNEIAGRIEFTEKEIELSKKSDMSYKNMVYHIRKWDSTFQKNKSRG